MATTMGTTISTGPAASSSTTAALPTTVQQVLRLARFQLRDFLRSRRFLLMMVLVAAIGGIVSAALAYYRPAGLIGSPSALYGSFWGGGVPFVIVLAAVIYGADAIAGEFQNRTGYFLMGLPIRRVAVYAGKYLAAFAASAAAVALYLVILLVNGVYYLGGQAFPWQLGASAILSLVYLSAVLGAAFLFSSLFKTSTYATLLVAVLFLFGFSLLEELVVSLAHLEPWFIISYASPVMGDIFQTPYPPHVVVTHLRGPDSPAITSYNPTVAEGVAVMLGYFISTTVVGLLAFEREEFS